MPEMVNTAWITWVCRLKSINYGNFEQKSFVITSVRARIGYCALSSYRSVHIMELFMHRVFAILILSWLIPAAVLAQASDAFEVASIKPSDPNTQGISFSNSPGAININGATAKLLIQQAYDVRESQISGGPGWIGSDRFDIAAKADASAAGPDGLKNPADQAKAAEKMRARLQNLLKERFHLVTHRETKELAVYVMTLAKGGPKFKETKEDPAEGKDGNRPRRSSMRVGRGQIIAQSIPMDNLARLLSQQLGRTVIDKTGLQGNYDFTLEWTPDPGQSLGGGPGGPVEPSREMQRPDNAPDANGPSVFTAIQEQLGIKLESQKAPVEMLVIESIEKPSEN